MRSSEQEKQFVAAHEQEVIRDKLVIQILENWTGKTIAEQGRIISETTKGGDWRKTLAPAVLSINSTSMVGRSLGS